MLCYRTTRTAMVQFTLEQAVRAHRISGGIASLFLKPQQNLGGRVFNSAPRSLYLRERDPGTHCIGVRVGPRAGLDGYENVAPIWTRTPDRPARSESLYRLSYPGPV